MDTTGMPTNRADAKATGAKYYFTGEPCKHGHIAPRKTKGACVECLKDEWQRASETRAEYFKAYNKSDAGKEVKNRYYEANKDAVIAKARATPNQLKNQYRRAWKDANGLAIKADNKTRRRKHRDATPSWLTRKQRTEIRAIYQAAILSTQITGQRYVVDHIYPLRSEVVCGLHVPWNLRILTQEENLRKSNTLPGDEEAIAFPPKK
jgi:5-methylcytosine-specific restriction endonuclease McrA